MAFPFSFEGRMGRFAYALWSIAAFFSQHLFVLIACRLLHITPQMDAMFWIAPLRSLVTQANASNIILIGGLAYFLAAAWVLGVLAFRRAHDADLSEALALWAAAPLVQIPIVLLLAVAPPRAAAEQPANAGDPDAKDYAAAVLGVVAGIGVTLAAVAISTLVFGTYGFGLFFATPFLIGATTGYLANRKTDIGGGATAKLVIAATALGGIGLIVAALEGLICIVLASPLVGGVALIGGLAGRGIALAGKRSSRQVVPAFALLPVVFALEHLFAVPTSFDTVQSVAVNAPVETVWNSILHMDRIEEPLSLPYRLGVAYPIRGDVLGEGVGAVRHGEFSTGTAIERVTEWVPNRKLAFVVEKDIPAMHEMSPYEHVHAPHVVGYFTTGTTSFELAQRSDGVTEVTLRTSHEIRLDPILYWMPMARWMVAENNARVLAHIRHQSERSPRTGP
jgi:uncharacterized membrane protein YhaH (DUF805 family)